MAKDGAVVPGTRLVAIDWLRGVVMVLMTLDHSSDAFNAGRLFTDSAAFDSQRLPMADFLTRWVTHICAPTFVFLAGTGLALSIQRRTRDGERPGAIDRHIILRGLIIAAFELWMSLVFGNERTHLVLQVLYAIGLGMVCMAALRRLSTRWLLCFALLGWVVSEPLAALASKLEGPLGILPKLLFSLAFLGSWGVEAYPVFPWLCTMVLGFCFGRWLLAQAPERQAARAWRLLLRCGLGLLTLYLVLRGVNSYGNMALYRHDGSLVQWLHVSKYPPSLAYWGLELGLAALLLALAFAARLAWAPLVLLGQTALFYYLLHAHLLKAASLLLGMHKQAGLLVTYLATVLAVLVLLPLCSWYRGYKRAHPKGWPQYI
jgi:uncharacterized membrane protein